METLCFLTSLLRYDLIKPLTKRFALVKFGGGITAMSGSIAGNTFARNRYGAYVRSRTKPVNPNSWRQVYARTIMSYLTEYWFDELSIAQRESWATYAAGIPMKNKLGETIKLSGFNHFVRSNSVRKWYGASIGAEAQITLKTAPAGNELPPKDPDVAIDVDAAPQKITVTFNKDEDWCSESFALLIMRQGVPQKGSRNFFKGPYKSGLIILGNAAGLSGTVDFAPTIPVAEGQKQWCTFRISRADGGLTEPWDVSATVHGHAPGEVPNVIGMTQALATAAIIEAQLVLGNVTEANSDTVPVGCVISQDPVAHTRLNVGDPVHIVVSLGPAE